MEAVYLEKERNRYGNRFGADHSVQRFPTTSNQEVLQLALVPLTQTGANCGMFALAMALQEFLEGDGSDIAAGLQDIAKQSGYSIMGEMFNADHLADVGNIYLAQRNPPVNYRCEVRSFNSQGELEGLLSLNAENNTRVLFPYASLGAIPQKGSAGIEAIEEADGSSASSSNATGHLDAKNMSHAHWSVINKADDLTRIQIYEGHQTMNSQQVTAETLFASNQILGDEFDWSAYDQDMEVDEIGEAGNKNMVEGHPFVEEVNLRGKVVLVGRPPFQQPNRKPGFFGTIYNFFKNLF